MQLFKITLILCLLYTPSVFAKTLTVAVHNIKKGGQIRLVVFDAAAAFDATINKKGENIAKPVKRIEQAVKAGDARLSFKLPKGDYAMILFVDTNGNAVMDRSLLGKPVEQFGFSNNPEVLFAPPTFEDTVFKHKGGQTIEIKL